MLHLDITLAPCLGYGESRSGHPPDFGGRSCIGDSLITLAETAAGPLDEAVTYRLIEADPPVTPAESPEAAAAG